MAASQKAQAHQMVLAEKKPKAGAAAEEHKEAKDSKEATAEEDKSYVPMTHVDTNVVQAGWAHGAPHPRALVNGEDHYVTVGKPYVPKVDIEQMAAWQKAHQQQQQKMANKASAPTLPGGQVVSQHQQLVGDTNQATAPTLPGGVAVPGGHVVWMPLHSLSDDKAQHPAQAASPKQALASPHIVLPTQYSKIVEYGSDGKPIATIYGPEAGAIAGSKLSERGREEHHVQTLAGDDDDSADGGDPDAGA